MAGQEEKEQERKTFRCDLCGKRKPIRQRGLRFPTGQQTCQACREEGR